jgi:hypothetical protein
MNNFIVGQVTPDMLTSLRYGTYIFFGILTSLGALFIAFFVPETKQLSLGMHPSPSLALFSPHSILTTCVETNFIFVRKTEEMDVVFGSEGVAASDYERQADISREIGLDAALARLGQDVPGVKAEKSA